MSITKTLGGERLGTGSKVEVRMHNFERSTHNLSREWKSTMNVGTLIPCFKELALPGDAYDINIESLVKTQPTTGPLFGSFKMQVDFFSCPIRLYNAALHNNMLGIGLKMSEIKFPMIIPAPTDYGKRNNNSSLLAYLGIRGYSGGNDANGTGPYTRKYNALPYLAYYDIFKNYYANKQEQNAYVIAQRYNLEVIPVSVVINTDFDKYEKTNNTAADAIMETTPNGGNFNRNWQMYGIWVKLKEKTGKVIRDFETRMKEKGLTLRFELSDGTVMTRTIKGMEGQDDVFSWYITKVSAYVYEVNISIGTNPRALMVWRNKEYPKTQVGADIKIVTITSNLVAGYSNTDVILNNFTLDNIDRAREDILTEGKTPSIPNYQPYSSLHRGESWHAAGKQMGICVKTYLSDIFNNWLNSESIIGDNGIAALTAVDTSGGSFTIDSLILANKVYNMLNRIAVSGGSYDDWQEVVYGEEVSFRAESPIYLGGMSRDVYFDEVVSTSDSTAEGNDVPLGSLAGKGQQSDKRGGFVSFRVNEPSYIIGIVSLTPRIDYSQGNDWDMMLDNLDDLHKPNLDGIGFQDLMQETMDCTVGPKVSTGKQPAWINYMTSYNKNYGDFAAGGTLEHMVLNRNYEIEYISDPPKGGYKVISDMTTYIDPRKYNYIFADSSLNAENFWVQLGFRVEARRKISAKVMPNL